MIPAGAKPPLAGEGREVVAVCLLLFGDDAELMLDGAAAGAATARWPAAAVAEESGLALGELPGRRFMVRVTEGDGGPVFSGFRLSPE